MLESLTIGDNVSFILVFLGGIFSFFSPCVIPLIPVYVSYLAGNTKQVNENGEIKYNQKKVFLHTLFFVIGISFAFFILGLSFSALGAFFNENKNILSKAGGIIIIVLGLFQLGLFNSNFLNREKRINLKEREINPFTAFLTGFTFSFAWTPCIGPILSSVLIMASNAKSSSLGNFLVLIYSLGFVIPFLLLGVFTTQVLNFLKGKQKFLKYTVKAGGVLLIIIGVMTFTGMMNGVSRYFSSLGNNNSIRYESNVNSNANQNNDEKVTPEKAEQKQPKIKAYDFTLTDQYGKIHTLSDYKGKVVFLNFWATWCPPCRGEMPHIEEIYNELGKNKDDVVILGVANPKSETYPYSQDISEPEIKNFLKENGYTFPTVFDASGEVFNNYYVNAFPTTFMIDRDGNIFGYVPGALSKESMLKIIEMTKENIK